MDKKLLVAVDGSVYSFNTLRYLGQLFKNLKDVRFHLLCIVPAGSPPAGGEWLGDQELLNTMRPAIKTKHSAAQKFASEAILKLARGGVDPDLVTTEIRLSRQSVADDLIHEARKGLYDAVIIGRRGIGKLEEMILGSASATILDKCSDVPVWVIDGQVNSRKFLVPLDGTSHSLKAVDHLAHILKGNPYAEVTLFHSAALLASRGEINKEDCHPQYGEEWCDIHTTRPDSLFHAPEQLLKDSGFPAERVHRLQTTKGLYPSRQIVRQALIDDFGTIVMGRRDSQLNKGVFKGVTNKVIGMAVDVAIWIVG